MTSFHTLKIGKKLKSLREEAFNNMSQSDFAAKLNIPLSSYKRYETDESAVDFGKVKEIAQTLNLPLLDFLPTESYPYYLSYKYGQGGIIYGNFNYYHSTNEAISSLERELEKLRLALAHAQEKITWLEEKNDFLERMAKHPSE